MTKEVSRMSKLLAYANIEMKIAFRIPIAFFFTLIFPQILLITLTMVMGNEMISPGIFFVDIYVPLASLISIMSNGIISFSFLVAGNRKKKLWVTYIMRGLRLRQIITAPLIVNIFICWISTILLIITGLLLFNAQLPDISHIFIFFGIWLIFAVGIFMIGFAIGSLSKNEKTSQSISTVIMFVLMILSGLFINYNSLPLKLQKISDFLITTQANKIMVYYWNYDSMDKFTGNWVIVAAWIILLTILVIFRLRKDNLRRT